MIKSLLNADEETSPKNESAVTGNFENSVLNFESDEEKAVEPPSIDDQKFEELFAEIERKAEPAPEISDQTPENAFENAFEVPEDAKFFAKPESFDERLENISSMSDDELEKLLENEEETYKTLTDAPEIPLNEVKAQENSWENLASTEETRNDEVNAPNILAFEPESQGETMRKSGLAYSAAIVLLASVVFMMLLGWFADLLLGSSPWGIVGGIVLGGIIGFIQFFRISSSIFKKEN